MNKEDIHAKINHLKKVLDLYKLDLFSISFLPEEEEYELETRRLHLERGQSELGEIRKYIEEN